MDISSSKRSARKINVRRMAVIGILSAISIMLSMIPGIGYIPIGPTNATIMHIPVIIGAIIEGPVVGIAIGFMFGMTSLVRALTMPTPTTFPFINPLISVLPRLLIGIGAYYIFKLVMKSTKENKALAGWIAGLFGSIINTVGVLGMIYLLYGTRYAQGYAEATETAVESAGVLISTLILTNGIPEAIVGGFLVSALSVALVKVKKRKREK